jgi:hypothetical protein
VLRELHEANSVIWSALAERIDMTRGAISDRLAAKALPIEAGR